MTAPTDAAVNGDLWEYHGSHVVWCTNHDADEFPLHTEDEPYCSKQVSGVSLIPEGDVRRAQMWVYTTCAFTHGTFTAAEAAAREQRYNSIELTIEALHRQGEQWDEQRIRLTSDAARSLAAALIRAADIEQGLTR